jgi:hypothetical protein
MKTCYSALFGNYEELKDPTVISKGWQYIVFTDQPIESKVWRVIQVPLRKEGPIRTARYYKIMFHHHISSEFSMWVDASFTINVDLNLWWEKYFKRPFTTPYHPLRNCVYEEVAACIRNVRGDVNEISAQGKKYRRERVPARAGMISSGILMRQKVHEVERFCELWYHEMMRESTRDQLAWAYTMFKHPVAHYSFVWDYRTATDIQYTPHYNRRKQIA